MGSVLKGNRYRLVDNRSFELPLPLKYELLKEDSPIAEYEISMDEKVSYRIITKYKEDMITPIYRPLDISDVYYFFSCRVFQDRTPFTMTELSLLGLEKYNVYDIIRKTRGVTPYDTYWLRFDGDDCDYETARGVWDDLMQHVGTPGAKKAAETHETSEPPAPKSDADVGEILNQHKVDVAAKFAQKEEITKEEPNEPEHVTNNTMSADEIEALLIKSGLTDLAQPDEAPEKPELAAEEKSSGGMMNEDEIAAMLAAVGVGAEETATAETAVSDIGEDIGAILDAVETAPVEEKPSGGKMSQEDIEAMLAAASGEQEDNSAEQAATETVVETAPVEEKPSGGKMSQEDIEAMLAAASGEQEDNSAEQAATETVVETAPVEKKPSGGKMSQEDIEAMLAAASGEQEDNSAEQAATETVVETAPVEKKPSGGKMSQEDIEAMLAAASGAVGETAETVQETLEDTAPEDAVSGGKMSEADIEALLNGMKEDAST